jgi:peroxiredoxin
MGRPARRRLKTAALLAAVVMAALGAAVPAGAESGFGEEKFKVGDKAADFTTVDLDGAQVTLSSYQGQKVVLLNFWGLRCGACIEEIPHLNVIHDKYKDKGLVVLGVDTDGVDAETVVSTMKEVGLNPVYTILLDVEFTITDTYTNFLVPLNLVIDKDGIVQYIHTGYAEGDEKDLDKAVAKALGI